MERSYIKEVQGIQYLVKNDEHWLYNTRNNRTIVSQSPIEDYLLNESMTTDNPLFDFVNSVPKFTITNINLFKIIVPSKKISRFHDFILQLLKLPIVLSALLISLICFFQFSRDNLSMITTFSITEIVGLYLILSGIIFPLHEYAHFAVYYKNFKPKHTIFGFSLRYMSMTAFFIKVPFFKLLDSKQKKELILAGVKIQTIVWFLLTILYYFFPSLFLYHLMVLNLVAIIINLVPFFKMDGYWYLCEILRIDDYSQYFKDMISRKEKFRFDVFILGLANYVLILLSLFNLLNNIVNYI